MTGFAELEKTLRTLPTAVAGRALASALKTASEPIAEEASRLAPRSDRATGGVHLADSIAVRSTRDTRDGDLQVDVAVGPDRGHFYGMFWEFGTIFHRARPWLRPAWDRHHRLALQIFAFTLWEKLEAAALKLRR
jgi:HK97 gp10 family phage protein